MNQKGWEDWCSFAKDSTIADRELLGHFTKDDRILTASSNTQVTSYKKVARIWDLSWNVTRAVQ